MPADEAAFLSDRLLAARVPRTLANPKFSGQLDGRHIEDCMLYRGVATGILRHHGSDAADDLSRARRVFDWVVRQVQLVPPGSLAPPPELLNLNGQTFQAQARPFDALLRGLATEVNADWAERSAIFLVLCRQLGLDAGLIAVVPPTVGQGSCGWRRPPRARERRRTKPKRKLRSSRWPVACSSMARCTCSTAGSACRFRGPTAGGLPRRQAASDPAILARLDLPDARYRVRARICPGAGYGSCWNRRSACCRHG